MSDHIIYTSDAGFDADVLSSPQPVLVDYWAEWCGPCKAISPILDEISTEYAGKVTIAKINIDDNPNTAPKYGVRSIPTLMLFKDGEVEAVQVGLVGKEQLIEFLNEHC
jgi:thioredoxin 1